MTIHRQIYIDQKASKDIRASAQGFIALITYGVGIGLGSILSGKVVDAFTSEGVKHWGQIWWVPCVLALVIALLFTTSFKDEGAKKSG